MGWHKSLLRNIVHILLPQAGIRDDHDLYLRGMSPFNLFALYRLFRVM